jgi:DNA mismatch endonuclease (patch repair protein)
MWHAGIRYRKQYKRLPGCPDFAIPRAKIVIFCDSSFWHGRGWPEAASAIKTNREFWIAKIEGNIARDRAVTVALRKLKWRVLRFWDDEIVRSTDRCVQKVRRALDQHG